MTGTRRGGGARAATGPRSRDAALAGATWALTLAVWSGLRHGAVPGGAPRWLRTNHAGNPVTLLEGLALVGGAAAGGMACGPVARVPAAGALAVCATAAGAGAVGALDDLRQDADRKGLAGHLGALLHGRITTGTVKVLGLGATGLLAAALLAPPPRTTGPAVDVLLGAAVVAGSANLANLLDLRPGRALKAALLAVLPLLLTGPGSVTAAVTAGAAAALLPTDLRGTSMLGDTGANPLGALVGLALLERQTRRGRVVTVLVLTALTLSSERVSFTQVIEATPVLREVDGLGRLRR